MRVRICICAPLLACTLVGLGAKGQQYSGSPLGVLVEPKTALKPSPELRRLLPRAIRIRFLAQTKLAPEGETIVVYDGKPAESEPYPHIAIVQSGRIVKDYGLHRLIEYGEGHTAVGLLSFPVETNQEVAVVAFRNIGDGASSPFVALAWVSGTYKVVFKRHATQGRLKVLGGETPRLELWSAADDLSPTTALLAADNKTPIVHLMSVVWGPHRYQVETYEWREGKFVRVSKWKTKKFIDPARMAARPLVLVKPKPQALPANAAKPNS